MPPLPPLCQNRISVSLIHNSFALRSRRDPKLGNQEHLSPGLAWLLIACVSCGELTAQLCGQPPGFGAMTPVATRGQLEEPVKC